MKIACIALSVIMMCNVCTSAVAPDNSTDQVSDTAAIAQPVEPDFAYLDVPLSHELQKYTYDMCAQYNIPDYYELVIAVMQHESGFNASAISSTNDYGLMQINVCNHKWLANNLGLVDMLDPYQNIHAGVYMLSNLLTKYDSPTKALMCYNLGEAGARRYWNNGVYSTKYSEAILGIYNTYII